jgi:hypothetical protein
MKKIISFCLYNNRPKDVLNGVINCFLAPVLYPDWVCRFYVDSTIPPEINQALHTFDKVEVVEMPKHRGDEAMLWRFLPASDTDVDVMISRDADSWLNSREVVCVNQWLNSDKGFHIIRDHCYHSKKIMGGMWGVKNNILPEMKTWCDEYSKSNTYDQGFLAEKVYPIIVNNVMVHLGDQYNNQGQKTNGYFNDGGIPIPAYAEIDEPVNGFSFEEISKLNANHCAHCKKTHAKYIGGIMEKIPSRSLMALKEYFFKFNINTSIIS